MKYKILLALVILIAGILPAQALQIVFQSGKEVLFKGEEAKFEFAIINTYGNDNVVVETKIDSVVIESDLDVKPNVFFEGGALLPKEGLVVQFKVKADKIGDHRLKVKVYYTRAMFSSTEFGASIVSKDVIVKDVLLKVVDDPTIVLKNETLVLNEVNKVDFKLIGLGDGKAMVEPLFDSKPSVFYFNSLKDAKGTLKFIPKAQDSLKFKIRLFDDSIKEYVVSIKPKYVRSNGVSAFLQLPNRILKNDCVGVKLGILNLRKDDIRDVMVKFAGNGTAYPQQLVVDKIASGEQKYLNFKLSPNDSKLKFFIVYFDEFGNAHPVVVEKDVAIENYGLLKITNLTVSNGKVFGSIVNSGDGKLLDVTASCGDKEVFVGVINPHSAKNFEIEFCKVVKVKAKNEVGDVIETEKAVSEKTTSYQKEGFSALLVAIVVFAVLVALVAYRRKRI